MAEIEFSKYSGGGNDFILFDNLTRWFPVEDKGLIHQLCQRRLGIGADGIVLIEPSTQANFRMRIFNADGSEATMCGNGLRCAMKYLQDHGHLDTHCLIQTEKETHRLTINDKETTSIITASMSNPQKIRWHLPITVGDTTYTAHCLDTGVPHAVIFVDTPEAVDLDCLGPAIRHHKLFSPHGTNVNIARVDINGTVMLRTYERGVEAETLACGTGATATAIAAAHTRQACSPVSVQVQSGAVLEITFDINDIDGKIENVTQTGPATLVFHGKTNLPIAQSAPPPDNIAALATSNATP